MSSTRSRKFECRDRKDTETMEVLGDVCVLVAGLICVDFSTTIPWDERGSLIDNEEKVLTKVSSSPLRVVEDVDEDKSD